MTFSKIIRGDRVIWAVILILSVVSLLSVYSSTGSLAYKAASGDTFYYLMRQLVFIAGGILTIIIVQLFHYRRFKQASGVLLVFAIVLLLITLVKGREINDASRWLGVPGTSQTFQPSELAKFILIVYLSRVLSANQNNMKDFKGVFLKLVVIISIVCLLILPANLSTAAMVFTVSLILLFVGRVPFKFLAMFVGIGVAGLALFLLLSLAMSREGRIDTWKNRIEQYVSGDGDNFQADQAKVAIVRGGLLPNGPGTSTQRNLLPHPYSDFIFAIIIEEYGSLVGGLLVLLLYLWLLFRTGLIVRRSKSTFAAFLAFGLSLVLVFQAFINMGVAVGLLPVTGQTLPLVSYGGSSIIFTSMALGMIVSASWGVKQELSEDILSKAVSDAAAEVSPVPGAVKSSDSETEIIIENNESGEEI